MSVLNRVKEEIPGKQRFALTSVTLLDAKSPAAIAVYGAASAPSVGIPGEDKLRGPKLTHTHCLPFWTLVLAVIPKALGKTEGAVPRETGKTPHPDEK